MKGAEKAKTASPGEHGFAIDTHGPSPNSHPCEGNGSGTRDLIRSAGRVAMTALQSVLQAHSYRVVSERLSKAEFAIFLRFSAMMVITLRHRAAGG